MLKPIAYMSGFTSLILTFAVIYLAYSAPAGDANAYLFFTAILALLVSSVAGARVAKLARVKDGNGADLLDAYASYLHDFSLMRRIIALVFFVVTSILVYAAITFLGTKVGLPIAEQTITLFAFLPFLYLFRINFTTQFALFFSLAIMLPSFWEFRGFPWNEPNANDSTLLNVIEFVLAIVSVLAARSITDLIVRVKLFHPSY